MTWVKGQATWGTLLDTLAALACGEVADGESVTVAAGDQWVRDSPHANIPNCLRSPASVDVPSGAMSMRAGYWALTTPGANGLGLQTVCRQMTVRNAMTNRTVYQIRINTANSVAGDYSTASVVVYAWEPDTDVRGHGYGTGVRGGSSFTLNAAGEFSMDGMTVKLTDPSGILPVNAYFHRAFTSDFLGGIDFFPMYHRRAAAPTFTTAPPGVDGTDYALVEHAPLSGHMANINGNYTQHYGSINYRAFFAGLGIKTNTALTGAVYVCSFPIALHKIRMWKRTDSLGSIALTLGRTALDGRAANTEYRDTFAHQVSTWARPFMTAGQVVDSAVVSYWMSVKPDGIVLVLSGDPGLSGKVSASWVGTFTPYDPNYDKFPVMFNRYLFDYTGDNTEYQGFDQGYLWNYWSLRRRQDGTEGARDWQTGFMRSDMFEYGAGWSGMSYTWDQSGEAVAWGTFSYNGNYNGHGSVLPVRQLKPHPYDAKWWLYGVAYGDGDAWDSPTTPANPGTQDHRQIRGVVNTRWWYLPGDGWANLDELTDQTTSQKYLLVAADYNGIAGRHRVTTSTFMGGAAIAEV